MDSAIEGSENYFYLCRSRKGIACRGEGGLCLISRDEGGLDNLSSPEGVKF